MLKHKIIWRLCVKKEKGVEQNDEMVEDGTKSG